jgi:DNA-binding Lrp family transcriptional regulator
MQDTKKILDPIRVKILSAMRKKEVLSPNIRHLKRLTGFHRATIKSSIESLEKSGLITGYIPAIDPVVAGYGLKVWTYLQMDLSNDSANKNFQKIIKTIPNIYHCSEVITDKGYNISLGYLAKSVEDYYNNIQRQYSTNYPQIYNYIKERTVFYLSQPNYVQKNQSDTLIDILEKDAGV